MILGSQSLTAATNTLVFSVDTTRIIRQITFCDRGGTDQNMRLWIVPIDQSVEDKYAWIYDRQLPANSTLLFPLNSLSLEYGDSIWAYGSLGSLSVNVTD